MADINVEGVSKTLRRIKVIYVILEKEPYYDKLYLSIMSQVTIQIEINPMVQRKALSYRDRCHFQAGDENFYSMVYRKIYHFYRKKYRTRNLIVHFLQTARKLLNTVDLLLFSFILTPLRSIMY